MKRSASEVLRDLEIRVANLERRSTGNPGAGKDMFFPETVPTTASVEEGDFIIVLGDDKRNNINIRNVIEKFASAESSHISIERDVKYPMYRSGRISFADFILTCHHGDLKEFRSLAQVLEGLGVKFDVDSSDKRDLGF